MEEEVVEILPPYRDLMLKFPTKVVATPLLWDEEGNPKFRNMSVIDVIMNPTGAMMMTEFGEVPEMVKVTGYHVNIRALADEDITDLMPFEIHPTPETPHRIWA